MGGSYRHITDSDNMFLGIDLLDNLEDAAAALMECYHMIWWLTSGDQARIYEAWLEGYARPHLPPENLPGLTYARFWE
jgi:hypothetical protein